MMNSKDSKRVNRLIREIATGSNKKLRFPVMSGVVKPGSFDPDTYTCSVCLSVNDDGTYTDQILINSVSTASYGMVLTPQDGAFVWVAEIDGPGKWGIIKHGKLQKVSITIGSVSFELTDNKANITINQTKLNMDSTGIHMEANGKDLSTVLGNLITHIESLTVSTGVGPSGVPLNIADFVTDKLELQQILV